MKKETIKKIANSNITFAVVGGVVFWGIGKAIDMSFKRVYKEGFSDGVDARKHATEFADKLQEAIDKRKAGD